MVQTKDPASGKIRWHTQGTTDAFQASSGLLVIVWLNYPMAWFLLANLGTKYRPKPSRDKELQRRALPIEDGGAARVSKELCHNQRSKSRHANIWAHTTPIMGKSKQYFIRGKGLEIKNIWKRPACPITPTHHRDIWQKGTNDPLE